MAEGRSDGWMDKINDQEGMKFQVGWSDGSFHWQAEDMEYNGNGRLFSSDSEDGD